MLHSIVHLIFTAANIAKKFISHYFFKKKETHMRSIVSLAGLLTLVTTICSYDQPTIGTPLSPTATKVLLLGSGELGKEVAIELQRLGIEVIAVDRYENAPAMQVAHRSHVITMTDANAIRIVIEQEQPDIIVPEIEAIATDELLKLEQEGFMVVPCAYAAHVTMNRERIRRLAAETLNLKTSAYRFAQSVQECQAAVKEIGIPCVMKPIMSSSGKGQSVIKDEADIEKAWHYAQAQGRTTTNKVIIESFINFDYEITILTIRDKNGNTHFCQPIGHLQIDGDYRESWQPHPMSTLALLEAHHIAHTITDALGGVGIFGVELFIKGDDVYFSEVSPRPHDTGMVTLISQDLSEFALHARAILGLPIPNIAQHGFSASCALLVHGNSNRILFSNLYNALAQPDTRLHLFGKPEVRGHRRMGVALARGASIEQAREKSRNIVQAVTVNL